MAQSTALSTVILDEEGDMALGGRSLLQLDPSSLYHNWEIERHYNSITYESPRNEKKYSQPQHTRTKAKTGRSKSRCKNKKRKKLKDRWTAWEQKRATERSN